MSARPEARAGAYARAALLGNPSDGYGGRTIGVTIPAFAAEALVRPAEWIETGELALVDAAVKRFRDHPAVSHRQTRGGFIVSHSTSIPRQVGLGGSSAIVIATLRALCAFHDVTMSPAVIARLALSAETDLGIPAGLQDRVIQSFEGLVYMDLADERRDNFEQLEFALLPPLFVAFRRDASEPSAAVHSALRARFEAGNREVVETMKELGEIARNGREAVLAEDHESLGRLIRANFAARARLVDLDPRHLRMIEVADSCGAPANYAGSGGAIVGVVPAGGANELRTALEAEGCEYLEPELAAPSR